jgi:hypothetical protein
MENAGGHPDTDPPFVTKGYYLRSDVANKARKFLRKRFVHLRHPPTPTEWQRLYQIWAQIDVSYIIRDLWKIRNRSLPNNCLSCRGVECSVVKDVHEKTTLCCFDHNQCGVLHYACWHIRETQPHTLVLRDAGVCMDLAALLRLSLCVAENINGRVPEDLREWIVNVEPKECPSGPPRVGRDRWAWGWFQGAEER